MFSKPFKRIAHTEISSIASEVTIIALLPLSRFATVDKVIGQNGTSLKDLNVGNNGFNPLNAEPTENQESLWQTPKAFLIIETLSRSATVYKVCCYLDNGLFQTF